MRIALLSSCVHLEASLCQGKVRPHTSCCLITRIPVTSPVHSHRIVLAFFAVDVALVVVFLFRFLSIGLLERIAARNPKGFPLASPFGHRCYTRSGNSNVAQRDKKTTRRASDACTSCRGAICQLTGSSVSQFRHRSTVLATHVGLQENVSGGHHV